MPPLSALTAPDRIARLWLPVLLALALVLGGGSTLGTRPDGWLAGIGAFALVTLSALHVSGIRPLARGSGALVLLLGLLAALVVAQLVPAGAGAPWWADGSRAGARWATEFAGVEAAGTMSLDPDATLRFALRWLMPAAVAIAALGADEQERRGGFWVIVLVAAASAMLAIVQRAGIGEWAYPYPASYRSTETGGLFGNQNHQGSLLACAVLAGRVVLRRPVAFAGLVLLMLLGAVGSGSRAALLLVPMATLLSLPEVLRPLKRSGRKARGVLIGLGAAGLAALPLLAWPGDLAVDSVRIAIWRAGAQLGLDALPWGIGFGAFGRVYRTAQPLDTVGPAYVNEAHHELLQWWIEGGVPGILLAVAAAALLVWRLRNRLREGMPREAWTAILMLAILLLHGLVDYPTRTTALGALAMLCVALVLAGPGTRPRAACVTRWRRAGVLVALVPAAAAGFYVVPPFAAQQAYEHDQYEDALALEPAHADALGERAAQLLADDPDRARAMAREALARSPLQPAALRTLMLADDPMLADHRWDRLPLFGWRDRTAQLAAFYHALYAGETARTGEHAAALANLRALDPSTANAVQVAANDPAMRAALLGHVNDAGIGRLFEPGPQPSYEVVDGIVALLRARGEETTWRDAAPLLDALARTHQSGRLRAIAAWLLADASPFGNERRSARDGLAGPTPFDWRLAQPAGSRVRLDGDALRIDSNGAARGVVARRLLLLEDGRHAVGVDRVRGKGDLPVSIEIACLSDARVLASTGSRLSGSDALAELRFETGASCPVVELRVAIAPSDSSARTTLERWRVANG